LYIRIKKSLLFSCELRRLEFMWATVLKLYCERDRSGR